MQSRVLLGTKARRTAFKLSGDNQICFLDSKRSTQNVVQHKNAQNRLSRQQSKQASKAFWQMLIMQQCSGDLRSN